MRLLGRLLQVVVLTVSMMILVLFNGATGTRLQRFGLAMPWFRLQVYLRHNKSFDVLFHDDSLRCVRSAMVQHHGDHDHIRRGPRQFWAVLGFLTHT